VRRMDESRAKWSWVRLLGGRSSLPLYFCLGFGLGLDVGVELDAVVVVRARLRGCGMLCKERRSERGRFLECS
jgi:hypothetical protein